MEPSDRAERSGEGRAFPVAVTFRMWHVRPRWALTIDPHLLIDGRYIAPLHRTPTTVTLDVGPRVVVIVSPTHTPPKWKLDPEFGPSLVSPYVYRTVDVRPGDSLDIRYRPNLLSGYIYRGRLRVTAAPPTEHADPDR